MHGSVVQAADVAVRGDAAGVSIRMLFDAGSGGQGLVRHLVEVPAGSRLEREASTGGALWFVISGSGRLQTGDGVDMPLRPDRGVWVPPGARPVAIADDTGELRLDLVTLPGDVGDAASETGLKAGLSADVLVRDVGECAVEMTGDRRSRVLFGPGFGCSVATQFVGEIPPGRAPDHRHPYDETVMVLAGEGVVHIDGGAHPLSPGTCTHLPPGLPHCLENTGATSMRVLGVFHPADSPAAKLSH
ncbi:MAG TPA: cupin domain-containing protein [Streptosporangiaceae bacterium]|nr:cupin domain-containing protein [Streptosporangiaceae bacterium]